MLKRPSLLVQTAQAAARNYRHARDLPGAVPGLLSRASGQIVPYLLQAEADCEDERKRRVATYRPSRHVQVLAALLAESAQTS